jgi:hypothetical protein
MKKKPKQNRPVSATRLYEIASILQADSAEVAQEDDAEGTAPPPHQAAQPAAPSASDQEAARGRLT